MSLKLYVSVKKGIWGDEFFLFPNIFIVSFQQIQFSLETSWEQLSHFCLLQISFFSALVTESSFLYFTNKGQHI